MNTKLNSFGYGSRKLSPTSRILYGLAGLFLILIDIGILYVMYAAAAWVSGVLGAPYVVTLLLLLIIGLFTGGVVLMIFVVGIIAIYGALVG